MYLNSIDFFIKVVEAGSFTGTAKALGVPNSTVSVRVSQLEESLGVTLLQRTTRRVAVTDVGMQFYKRCSQALQEIETAKEEAGHASLEPQGELRLTSSIDIGHSVMPPLIKRYMETFPKVSVELLVTNQRLDLIAENIDVAARIGNLQDSTLKARKLGETTVGLYASAEFLKEHGAIDHPRDLEQHQFIGFRAFRDSPVKLYNQNSSFSFKAKAKIWCDDPQVLKAFVVASMGIGFLTHFHVSSELQRGDLVKVLPDWSIQNVTLSLVYPGQRFLSAKVRSFIDIATEEFARINPF